MALDRDELIRQKALIEEQLRWVNQKLSELRPTTKAHAHTKAESAEASSPTPAMPPPAPGPQIDAEDFNTGDPATGVTTLQKLGCVVFAILLVAGALFLMFILPHLIY